MIKYIFSHEKIENERYIQQYFKLRKRIFCDGHGWVKPNRDGTETDHLDETYNLYILYIDEVVDEVVGGVRLTPSTGQTLMHETWEDMLPEPDDFRSPNIWEATRFCVDETRNQWRSKNFVNKIFLGMTLAILDFATENGISSVMGVCESRVVRMFLAFGGGPEVISTKTEVDGCEISFVVWPTNEKLRQSFEWARPYVGGTQTVRIDAA